MPGGIFIMINILFVCHGSTVGSRELAALVGQNGANRCNRSGGVLRFYCDLGYLKRNVWKTRLEVQLLHFGSFIIPKSKKYYSFKVDNIPKIRYPIEGREVQSLCILQ